MKVKEKIQREIHLWKMFHHPHIVKLYEYFDTKDDIYVVFEYICKGELFELISNKGQLDEEEARRYFHQIIFAIDYAHGFGVAHRDLKPENIMLDSHDNIKLVDFGLSNVMKEGRALKTSWGSPNYAAPEVINGKTYDGCQVDVWSWGVILFAMLFGELPFDEDNINTMFKHIKNAKYYMKDAASIEAKDLLNKMIQPDPFKRITISEIKNHPWFKLNIPRYLYEPLKDLKMNGTHNELDEDIVDMLFDLKLNINRKDRAEVEKAIMKGELYDFCIAYETLLHSKMMNKIKNDRLTSSIKPWFKRIQMHQKSIMSINHWFKVLENFGSEEIETNEDDLFNKFDSLPPRKTTKSFNTSRSSAANLKDLIISNEHK